MMPPASPRAVLHVTHAPDAGVPQVAGALVDDQVARGWSVSVAAPRGSDLWRHAEAAGARRLPWEATRSPGPSLPAELRRLARIVAAVRPDVVHLHSAKAGLAGRLVLRGRRVTVFQPHAWSFEAAGGRGRDAVIGWERGASRWTHVTVCVSEDERARGEAVGIPGPFAIVPNGIDLRTFPPSDAAGRTAARTALEIGEGPLAVLVGRLSAQKGHDSLLTAWPAVLERVPDAVLALVGEGPDRPALEARAVPRVLFAGKRVDVGRWLAAADVVVIASRWEAGMSLVAMEAMASARSVVTTEVAGMREGVGEDAGAVVAIDDPDALGLAVAARLSDPALAEREGRAGRRRMEAQGDVRSMVAQMAGIYDEAMARFAGRRPPAARPRRGAGR